ncbi:ABC-type Mn/Zn transport system, ATPase component [Rubidibacter lacunae KORDI 51-2]|uniref:ABC-type Mn/Zn transport system, ATPase component n=1 Tax=Rubidibacter lacunae KORDI 51-2 TaxID=582515 RepID=U5DDS5_9CHRO|nr:metal ABC transporter ATP-binding protein [Rubidibacter lacunae]ERN42663.1 ABC-type Mn/Zn transport system, ATPase component [Rubidibacter lacunae KORDI 51-2]
MLEIQNLSVNYRGVRALHDVSFQIPEGQLVGILGPNGAGKSTLVEAILNLVPVTRGVIRFQGLPLRRQLLKISYVPQRSKIDWDYPVTVWNTVMMAQTVQARLFRGFSPQARELAEAALARVEIYDLKDRPIGELSGGQQQRVFLARALAKEAELYIFDEPFTSVDRKTEDIIFDVFQELRKASKTLLVIDHDLGESLAFYDRLLLLNKRLIAQGSPQEVVTADNLERAYGRGLTRVFV